MMTIYVLQGSTGQYSDRTDWIVRAYGDKGLADIDRTKADYEAEAYKTAKDAYEDSAEYLSASYEDEQAAEEVLRRMLTVDPKAQTDYTGTTYWVVECELLGATC